nr:chemotaxis protein CheB [Flavisolibacter tropicus]
MPRNFQSHLKDILQQHSQLQLINVAQSMPLRANTVYIAPSAQDLILKNSKLELVARPVAGQNLCVDRFFGSMAKQELGKRAIGVILSGSGFDGVSGAQAIKSAGGLEIAQDPLSSTCKYLPQHAIEGGSVDHVAEPLQIPQLIQEYALSI